MYILGNFLYIAVLLINAIAVLSEDRFLARSTKSPPSPRLPFQTLQSLFSWQFNGMRLADLDTNKTVNLSPSSYDPAFGQSTDASVKAKIINLIASVRTLMRTINTLIILYELILG
ncbi:protein transport protein [Colletotrichum truncatum]|uniref:Protein transport protein n=1 Tax=Colletotrichum truncatum TaxID=5467 RepID=A0ACC3Z3U3_COLTU